MDKYSPKTFLRIPGAAGRTLCLAAALLLAGCGSSEQPAIPKAQNTASIEISRAGQADKRNIVDPKSIARLAELLEKNKNRASLSQTTFPTPETAARFLDAQGKATFVLWLGPGWIGTKLERAGNAFLEADAQDAAEIRRLLGEPGR